MKTGVLVTLCLFRIHKSEIINLQSRPLENPPMSNQSVNRRAFLATGAAAGAALTLPASSYANIAGANEKARVAFLGVGGRCQQHIDVVLEMRDKNGPVTPVAVCDVWDGDPELGNK